MIHSGTTRAGMALRAREQLGEDFFGGWQPEDLALFEKYACPTPGSAGFITDFLGAKTATAYLPWAAHLDGGSLTDVPVPDDGLRAEAIEYFALLTSLERSRDDSFVVIELGASYAPWACAAGLLARRLGKKSIVLRAVEASSYFHKLIDKNFLANGLGEGGDRGLQTRAIRAAVAEKPGTMFFPVVSSAFDNGSAAAASAPEKDYVGRSIEHEEVPVVTLNDVFEGLTVIDLVHCDIQGAEVDVLVPHVELLNSLVKHLFVGTHSRKIEGILLECLHANGWRLLRERPTKFVHRPELPSLTGMTTRDGGQFWVNPRFTVPA